jgi:hypothetical protein
MRIDMLIFLMHIQHGPSNGVVATKWSLLYSGPKRYLTAIITRVQVCTACCQLRSNIN